MALATVKTVTLCENASATTGYFVPPGTGWHILSIEATWGGGTVKLQRKCPNGTAADVGTDATMTEDGHCMVYLASDDEVRINIATATGVYANLKLPRGT